jgi:serine/threonine-protein kinase
VFESGRLGDGCAYIVMEFLDGELLSNRLERVSQLPLREVLHLGRQISSALDVAHRKGIVHRDLKPDNVMIVHDPEAADGERVKIFDFGLAKLRSTSLSQATGPTALRTQPGMIMGTPTHMAPEQCRGASNIDGKADVYSLGVILYEGLVGHPPFFADNVGELMTMHLRDPPPGLRKLDSSIPKDLADLVHAMLAKDPSERPDMGEVCARLVALVAQRQRRPSESEPEVMPSAVADFLSEQQRLRTGRTTGNSKPAPAPTPEATDADSRVFIWAIPAAAVLVCISGALLFDVRLPGGRAEPVGSEAPRHRLASVTPRAFTPAQSPAPVPAPLPTPPPPARPPEMAASAEPAEEAAGPRLRWEVSSRPPGATVRRAEDGRVLGTTPWTLENRAQAGILRLRLQRDGYAEAGVVLDLTSPSKQTIILPPGQGAGDAAPPRWPAQLK